MPPDQMETKDKILQATLDMIKKEGFENVTIRKIAAHSDTNIALINYHFGSKDKLISEAIKIMLLGFRGTFDVLDDSALPPKERLKTFLTHYVQVIREHPELVSRIIATGTAMFASQVEYGEFLREMGFHKIQGVLQQITQEDRPDQLMMMITQLFGAIFLPALMKPILESGAGVKMLPVGEQIDWFFERYFHDE
ncbi:TetR/AcrR family transcriptional regulator [Paenibacillus elgii]|uniref:TetR/AcrR family transcriptional regulator n=1 Tax=Paenibacillus elgii TaxID=189691 RepID=UPI00203CAE90|nr:TetR/AcrR family transcriptional regulator [Paenibacillus elgii]MCM3268013.1 TetR/AcrR family transcriptional regulator [Paenibacillus elgii]